MGKRHALPGKTPTRLVPAARWLEPVAQPTGGHADPVGDSGGKKRQASWRADACLGDQAASSAPSVEAFEAVSSKLPWIAAASAWSRAIAM
jgi:hypothetical protein